MARIAHFHPDHVFGIPILLMNIWLLGRADPLPVYGLQDVLERFQAMMELFCWRDLIFHPQRKGWTIG